MPYKPNVATWMVLFGVCKTHNNVEMAEHVAKWVLELEHKNVVGYMLLSNIYVVARNRQDLRMLNYRKRKKVWRNSMVAPRLNWIMRWNVCGTRSKTLLNDWNSCKIVEIIRVHAWCTLYLRFILHVVEEKEKLFHLRHHILKLVIAFGLINATLGNPFQRKRNLGKFVKIATFSQNSSQK